MEATMRSTIRTFLGNFWQINPAMTLFWLASFLFLAMGVGGLLLDPRLVQGQPIWAKTTKFAISFLFYAPTMLWMYGYVNLQSRLKNWVLNAIAAILFVEMLLILLQTLRGQAMHFNVSTPFNAALWYFMSVTIGIFYLISFVGFFLLLRQKLADKVLVRSLQLGMALMLIGFGLGFLMPTPTAEQQAILATGAQPTMIGAHTVGAADGGPGLPLLGWSTLHGDLRIAHFVGIHGLQAIPLLGWWVSRRGNKWLTVNHQLALVWTGALGYLGLVGLVTWQALRGQSLLQPDGLTWGALLGLVGSVAVAIVAIRGHAQRQSDLGEQSQVTSALPSSVR
jgi:hypothetical protein